MKYPLISSTRSVLFDANTLIEPLPPAGTIAALDRTRPSRELTVATTGCVCPAGQTVRNPRGPEGITATFKEKAEAVAGMAHAVFGEMAMSREVPPVNEDPRSGSDGLVRVSPSRHGVIGTYRRGPICRVVAKCRREKPVG